MPTSLSTRRRARRLLAVLGVGAALAVAMAGTATADVAPGEAEASSAEYSTLDKHVD